VSEIFLQLNMQQRQELMNEMHGFTHENIPAYTGERDCLRAAGDPFINWR